MQAFIALACLVWVGVTWWAEEAWRLLPSPAICFDLRKDRTENRRFVLVNSRDSDLVGHAFVTWIENPADGGPQRVKMWGFYRTPGQLYEAVRAAPGEMLDERRELDQLAASGLLARRETRTAVVFWVDRDGFEASYVAIEKASQPGLPYALLSNDCVTAVARILRHFGLILPPRSYAPRPHDFIWAVIELNRTEGHECR